MRHRKSLKRTPLQRKKALKAGKPLARGTSEMKRSSMPSRKQPMKRGRWTRFRWEEHSRLAQRAHGMWSRRVTRRRCAVCEARGRPSDSHPHRDPHHILPARYIRGYVRSLRLPAAESSPLLVSLLYDVRNGMSLCRRCHSKFEDGFAPIPRVLIPEKAWQFARELGLERILDRLYV